MSNSRDFRSDPPSHQRLAARQAAASSHRSPDYPSDRHGYEQPREQYQPENYPQTRRVFTNDRDHRQDDRRDYTEDVHTYRSQARRSPNYYQQHPQQHTNMQEYQRRRNDHRRSATPTNRPESFEVKREDKWYDDRRNMRRSPPRSAPSPAYQSGQPQQRYERGRYSPTHEKGREHKDKDGRGSRTEYREYKNDTTSHVRDQIERFSERNRNEYESAHGSRIKVERKQSSDGYRSYEQEHGRALIDDRISDKKDSIKMEDRYRKRERSASPGHKKEDNRQSKRNKDRSWSREPKPTRNVEQAHSSRTTKEMDDAGYKKEKHKQNSSRERSKSHSHSERKQIHNREEKLANDEEQEQHSRSRERSHQSSKGDPSSKIKRQVKISI